MSFESVDQDHVWFSLLPKKSFSLWLDSQEMQVLALTEGAFYTQIRLQKKGSFCNLIPNQDLY